MKDTLRTLFAQAAQDESTRPSVRVVDGNWIFTINGKDNWDIAIEAACIPKNASKTIDGEKLIVTWPTPDYIFENKGLLSDHIDGYETRKSQVHMARLVQRTIDMKEVAVIEASTGVGKSLAYAAPAIAAGKKIIISTSNKALQMQLFKKDIPLLGRVFGNIQVALAVGKGNFICLDKGAKISENEQLDSWVKNTESGNIEELKFTLDNPKEYTAGDDCTGKKCNFYDECFYYKSKQTRDEANVIICNHALLALDTLYPHANILPGADVVIVDEAHQFPQYVRNALGNVFSISSIQQLLSDLDQRSALAQGYAQDFETEIRNFIGNSTDRQISVSKSHIFESGKTLSSEMHDLALLIWDPQDMPRTKEDVRIKKMANRILSMSEKILDFCYGKNGYVRWVEHESIKMVSAPHDVSGFIRQMLGFLPPKKTSTEHCAYCSSPLDVHFVNVLGTAPYCDHCIAICDLFGDAETIELDDWKKLPKQSPIENTRIPFVFTSATLATPKLTGFMEECGIETAMTMIAGSPFDYKKNSMLYIPNGTSPIPNHPDFKNFMVDEIRKLVNLSKGGAFVLFTSYANMKHAYEALYYDFLGKYEVMRQGELPKMEIIKQFNQRNDCVLFATKSFWEGVSIDGHNLRLIIIDKIPFSAPSPMLNAREAKSKNPFMKIRLPEAIIDLKQGAGRLIRTMDDKGVIAILDTRLRIKPYGRNQIIKSLPPSPLTDNTHRLWEFFVNEEPDDQSVIDASVMSDYDPLFEVES